MTDKIALAFAFGRVVEMDPATRPVGLLSSVAKALHEHDALEPLLAIFEATWAGSIRTAIVIDRAAAAKEARKRS